MQIKSIIIRLAVNADMRAKMLKQFPNILDGYIVTGQGEVLSPEEAKCLERLGAFNYFIDGLNFVNSSLRQ